VKRKTPNFEREVEIDVTVEKVWEVMTNPDQWPHADALTERRLDKGEFAES